MDSRSLARLSYVSILLVFLVTAFGVAFSGTAFADIEDCTVLDEPNQEHELVDDVEASETCIEITADGVTLEGNGHEIEGGGGDTVEGAAAVHVEEASDVTVSNVSVSSWRNGGAGVRFTGSEDGVASGVEALENSYSVYVDSSSDIELLDLDVDGGLAAEINGVKIESSSMVSVEDSVVDSNSHDGAVVVNSSHVTVLRSEFTDSREGAVVENSSDVRFLESTFADNDDSGVVFHDSTDSEVTDSHAFGNDDGFRLVESTHNVLTGNKADNNSVHGFSVEFLSHDNELSNNLAEHNDVHGFSLSTSDRNKIEENTAVDNGVMGFSLDSSSENEVVDNTADRNIGGFGLLLSADDNTLERNTATNNSFAGVDEDEDSVGISVESSDNNTLRDNAVDLNDEDGILLRDADGNVLENNTADDNGVDDDTGDGITLESSSDNVLVGNSASGNPRAGVALVDEADDNEVSGSTVHGNAVGVVLLGDVTSNTVEDNEVMDNDEQGVILVNDAAGNEVTGNHVENNTDGVALMFSADNNIVEENVLMENDEGLVVLHGSSGNQLELDRVRDSSTAAANVTNASGNIFTELDVGSSTRDNTTVSFTADYYRVSPVSSPADNPATESVGRYLELDGTDGPSEADVTFHYTEEDVEGLDEDTLAVWRHEGGDDWTELDSTVDTMEQTVSAEALESTVYGVFADELEPAEFTVEVTETNSPVVEGEALDVEVNVTNTGDLEDRQDVRLEDFDGVERDMEEVELAGGESTEMTLTWSTEDGDRGEGDVTVYSEDDTDNSSVQVLEPAYFAVEVLETNSPVTEGGSLDVDVEVTNTGEATEAKNTWLEDFDGVEQDNETVELDGGESTELRLTWETEEGDAGEDDVTVSTEDDIDTATVEIQEPDDAFFDVEITETNSPVTEGDTLVVDVNVTNLGEETATQEVNFTDFDGVERGSEEVELQGGEYDDTVEFTWETEEGDAGGGDAVVRSEDDDYIEEIWVVREGEIADCTEIDEPGEYELITDITGDEVCLQITADDVVVGGNSYLLEGGSPEGLVADTLAVQADDVSNLTLTDIRMESWDYAGVEAVKISNSRDVEVTGNHASDNALVTFEDSTSANVSSNEIQPGGNPGIRYINTTGFVYDNDVEDAGDAVSIQDSENVSVSGNVVYDSNAGAVLVDSSDVNVTDNEVTESRDGVELEGSTSNLVSRNYLYRVNFGITSESSEENQLSDNEVFESEEAIRLFGSIDEEVHDNHLEGYAMGVLFDGADENDVRRNYVAGGEGTGIEGSGVIKADSHQNHLQNNVIADNQQRGVALESSDLNEFYGNEIRDNAGWEVELDSFDFIEGDSVENEFKATNIGESLEPDTELYFTGELVRVRAVDEASDNPDATSIGRYFESEEVDDGAFLDVEVSYVEDDLGFVDESSLELWRYNSTEEDWEVVEGSGVDEAEQVVYADNVEEFGVFGVFGEEEEQPLFEVDVTGTSSPVTEGADLAVDGWVENTGTGDGEQELVLEEFSGVEVDSEAVEVEAGEREFFSLTWATEHGDAGEGFVNVSSDDTMDSEHVEVEEFDGEVDMCQELDASGDYYLTADLTSSETCLQVTADDVSVDGAGYSVTGDEPESEAHGVTVHGVDDIRLENLSIEGWSEGGTGVSVEHVDEVSLDSVDSTGNEFGVVVDSASNVSVVDGNFSMNDEAGFAANATVDSELRDSTLVGNDVRGVAFGDDSSGNLVEGNVVEAGEEVVLLQSSSENVVRDNIVEDGESGVDVIGFSDDNEIEGNVISGHSEVGVRVTSSDGNLVSNNTVESNLRGVGVVEGSENSTLKGNTVEDNDEGFVLVEADSNDVVENEVVENDVGVRMEASSGNHLNETAFNGNEVAVSFERFSTDNVVADSLLHDSVEAAVSLDNATDNSFLDVDLGNSTAANTTLSFEAEEVDVADVDDVEDDPYNESLGRYFDLAAEANTSYANVTFEYIDADVGDVDESTVRLQRYDSDDGWTQVESELDAEENEVAANVSTTGVYGLFGDLADPVENLDRNTTYDDIQTAVDDAAGGEEIVVRSGVYTESVGVDVANLTVRENTGSSAVISSTGSAVSIEADDVTVANFSLMGDPDVSVDDVENVSVDSVALENETVSLENVSDLQLESGYEESEPSDVDVDTDYGAYVEAVDGENSSVELTLTPEGGVDADAELWKHDGDDWREVDGEVEGDGVRAELLSGDFSTFAVYATSKPDDDDEEDDHGDDEDSDDGDVDDGGSSTAGAGLSAGGGVGDDYTPPIQSRQADPAGFSPALDAVVGEEMTFTGVVATEQVGESREVELSADGRVVATRSVDLGPYESERVTFTHAFTEPGEYDVRVDGEAVAYVVVTEPGLDEEVDDEEDVAEDIDEVEEAGVDEEEAATDVDGEPAYAWGEGMPGFTVFKASVAVFLASLYMRSRRRTG